MFRGVAELALTCCGLLLLHASQHSKEPLYLFGIGVAGVLYVFALARYRWKKDYLDYAACIQLATDPDLKTAPIGILSFKEPVTFTALNNMASTHLLCHERFRSLVVRRNWLWSYWVPATNVDLRDHLIEHEGHTSHSMLQDYISKRMNHPFDPTKPLWEIHLFTNFSNPSDPSVCSAVVVRFHHTLGDGIVALRVLMSASSAPTENGNAATIKDKGKATWKAVVQRVVQRKRKRPAVTTFLKNILPSMYDLFFMAEDPPHALHSCDGPGNTVQSAAWSQTAISVDAVKRIGKMHECTVNELIAAALSLGWRAVLLEKNGGKLPSDLPNVLTLLWIATKGLDLAPGKKIDFGNNIVGVYIRLPIELADPLAIVSDIQAQVRKLMASPTVVAAATIFRIIGHLPLTLLGPIMFGNGYKASLSLSNVPGPQMRLRFAGAEIQDMSFLVPSQLSISQFVTVFSFNGRITCGISTDMRVCAHAETLVSAFEKGMNKILKLK